MPYDSYIHHRRSIRLQGYDYSQAGMYYVTLCVKDRAPVFGEIVGTTMQLSEIGKMAEDCWKEIPEHFPRAVLDKFVIMPEHMHGIVMIIDERNGGLESLNNPVGAYNHTPQRRTPFRSPSKTLGAIIRGFKGASTKRINALRGTPGASVWQRNDYEHIIRDGNDLDRIRTYIEQNVEARSEQQELENESMIRDDAHAGQKVGIRHTPSRQIHS